MDTPKVVTIIQARMASSRLPGKVLKDIGGRAMLGWVVERARQATAVSETVVATTTEAEDDAVEAFCLEHGYPCFRGSMHDVLDRYYQAARQYEAEVIVRITADCPLIDRASIDQVVETFLDAEPPLDFAANRFPMERTVPIGLDTEICTFSALETAWKEAAEPHQREHVMPFFYEHPERFNILHIRHSPDYGHLRWAVDTQEDLEMVRSLVAHFSPRADFSWQEIIQLIEKRPELQEINAAVRHKDYREVDTRR
jgi:spore coat polysaccharide biosynthesis protein SpsF